MSSKSQMLVSRCFSRAVLVVALPVFLLACGSAHWRERERSPEFVPPASVSLHVELSREVEEEDDGGRLSELVDALEDELQARGVRAKLADPDAKPQYPRLTLKLLSASAGIPVAAYFGGFGMSEITISFALKPSASAAPTFTGTLGARSDPSGSYNDPEAGARAIARKIAEALTEKE